VRFVPARPADETQLVEQLHNTAGHIICGLVEKRLLL
jgi:hypothetical protein